MNKIKKSVMEKWHIILAFVAPAVLLLITYAIKGVYPFGNNSIAYYDMSQSYIPAYTHAWDVLHGLKSPFYTFNAGMGCSMTDIMGVFTFFPTNLFLLLIPRTNMLGTMSFFLIFKMMLISGTMALYVTKKTNNKLLIFLAGFTYATCGYVVQYYSNIYYLDSVILLPILMYSLEELIAGRKKIPYVISIFMLMLTNPQMMLMVGIFTAFRAFFMIRKTERELWSKAFLDVVVYTIIGMLISSCILVPTLIQTMGSARFEDGQDGGIMSILMTTPNEFEPQKLFMIYGSEIAIAVIIAILISGKITLRKYLDSIVMIVIVAMPIFFENINLLWHGGSYQHFPMRFGYMLTFECILLVIRFLTDEEIGEFKYGDKTQLVAVAAVPLLIIVLFVFLQDFRFFGIRELEIYSAYKVVMFSTVIFYLSAVIAKNKKLRSILIAIMMILQGSMATVAFVAPSESYSMEGDNVYVYKSEALYNKDRQVDPLERYKDRDVALFSNYGMIADVPSIGGWMNGFNPNLQTQMERMGYSINYTRILDGCGTLFTDAMLGVKRLISIPEPGLDIAYSKTDENNIYDCNYTLPKCFFFEGEADSSLMDFDYQNDLFRKVTGAEDDLFESYLFEDLPYEINKTEDTFQYTVQLDIDEPSVLYFFGENYLPFTYVFAVNNNIVKLPVLLLTDNQMYATLFLNGMVEAGEYTEGPIDVSIYTNMDAPYLIHVGLLKLSVLEEGLSRVNNSIDVNTAVKGRTVTYEYDSKNGGQMFIPIEYNDGWRAQIDGTDARLSAVMGNAFIGLDAPSGKHTITLKYTPKGLNVGIAMTVIGLTLLAGLIALNKKRKFAEIKVPPMLWNVYVLALAAALIFLYVIPVIYTVISSYAGIQNALNS